MIKPDTVYFHKTGSETVLTRTVRVQRTGPPAPFSVTTSVNALSGGNWLSVGALVGNTLTLTATPGSLAPGAYSAVVTVTPSGQGAAPLTITVFLNVAAPPGAAPAAMVRPATLGFKMVQGGANPESKTLNVSFPAGAAWTATRSVGTPPGGTWLQIANNVAAGLVTASVNGAGLAVGRYTGTITVTVGNSTVQVPVTLDVVAQGGSPQGQAARTLVVSPKAFNFIALPGAPPPGMKTLRIKTTRSTPVNWNAAATSDGNWLAPANASGTTPGSVQLTATPGGRPRGHYEGSVKVTAPGGVTETAKVYLRILGPPGPAAPAPAPGSPQGAPAVAITPAAVEFSSTGGVVTPASVPLQLSSQVAGLTFTASRSTTQGGAWLNISSVSGSIPATINVTVTPAGLAPGTYTGLITINVAGAVSERRTVLVTLRVFAAGETARLAVRPAAITFHAIRGGSNPAAAQVALDLHGAANVPYQATPTASWLSVNPTTGTAPRNVSITANIAGLAAGTYHAAVLFQATGSPGAIPITLSVVLTVTAPGQSDTAVHGLFVEPAAGFVAAASSPLPVAVKLFRSDGNPVVGAEVTVASSGDEPPFVLQEREAGIYAGVFRSLAAGPVALTATATADSGGSLDFGIGGDLEGAGDWAPVIFREGVVNSANFAAGATPVAAGAILSLFGRDLVETTAFAASFPLPRELAGVRVLVGGNEAPLIAVVADAGEGYDQINFQSPVELGALSHADVVVVNQGVASDPEGISIAPALPAIFTANQQGDGPAAALHADFGLITSARPARPGETVLLFATGLGATRPEVPTGRPAGADVRIISDVQVTIGGRPALVRFAGLAPGFVGLCQINVVVPEGIARGEAAVEIIVDGISSAEGVVLPIG